MATVAFIIGSSVGGAEWSSRSMTLQLLWEPRRIRLLSAKWLALLVVMIALAAIVLVFGLLLASLSTQLRGTWDGVDADFWSEQMGIAVRGGVLIALSATVGLAIATALRNTGAALGAAFVYFAVAEIGIRFALAKYGPDPYLVSWNSAALIAPDQISVPGERVEVSAGRDGTYEMHKDVLLTHSRAAFTLASYTAVALAAAVWSFHRRDVG
jgi:ABC-type transport system involved in multi-copper enzyme maturation permease subunit